MNKRIRAMIQEIEKRGGIFRMRGPVPDSVVESFLRDVLNCSYCRGAENVDVGWTPDEVPIDILLGGNSFRERKDR